MKVFLDDIAELFRQALHAAPAGSYYLVVAAAAGRGLLDDRGAA